MKTITIYFVFYLISGAFCRAIWQDDYVGTAEDDFEPNDYVSDHTAHVQDRSAGKSPLDTHDTVNEDNFNDYRVSPIGIGQRSLGYDDSRIDNELFEDDNNEKIDRARSLESKHIRQVSASTPKQDTSTPLPLMQNQDNSLKRLAAQQHLSQAEINEVSKYIEAQKGQTNKQSRTESPELLKMRGNLGKMEEMIRSLYWKTRKEIDMTYTGSEPKNTTEALNTDVPPKKVSGLTQVNLPTQVAQSTTLNPPKTVTTSTPAPLMCTQTPAVVPSSAHSNNAPNPTPASPPKRSLGSMTQSETNKDLDFEDNLDDEESRRKKRHIHVNSGSSQAPRSKKSKGVKLSLDKHSPRKTRKSQGVPIQEDMRFENDNDEEVDGARSLESKHIRQVSASTPKQGTSAPLLLVQNQDNDLKTMAEQHHLSQAKINEESSTRGQDRDALLKMRGNLGKMEKLIRSLYWKTRKEIDMTYTGSKPINTTEALNTVVPPKKVSGLTQVNLPSQVAQSTTLNPPKTVTTPTPVPLMCTQTPAVVPSSAHSNNAPNPTPASPPKRSLGSMTQSETNKDLDFEDNLDDEESRRKKRHIHVNSGSSQAPRSKKSKGVKLSLDKHSPRKTRKSQGVPIQEDMRFENDNDEEVDGARSLESKHIRQVSASTPKQGTSAPLLLVQNQDNDLKTMAEQHHLSQAKINEESSTRGQDRDALLKMRGNLGKMEKLIRSLYWKTRKEIDMTYTGSKPINTTEALNTVVPPKKVSGLTQVNLPSQVAQSTTLNPPITVSTPTPVPLMCTQTPAVVPSSAHSNNAPNPTPASPPKRSLGSMTKSETNEDLDFENDLDGESSRRKKRCIGASGSCSKVQMSKKSTDVKLAVSKNSPRKSAGVSIVEDLVNIKQSLGLLKKFVNNIVRKVAHRTNDASNEEMADIRSNSDRISELNKTLAGKIDEIRYNITLLMASQRVMGETVTTVMVNMISLLKKILPITIRKQLEETNTSNRELYEEIEERDPQTEERTSQRALKKSKVLLEQLAAKLYLDQIKKGEENVA
ncbi:uncharacterized protein LOC127876222 isoform X2 [Dreissena polymorpha]|uniref:Uncharacterized protein n=1 Tax=Dreissena polymorpha TaxID=45954 RepID=A0A9D4KDD1_DREPO|nr:uncharacterized protein LOC127876222 isoform X2 [Dreissena polymorpha]KAH3837429.1 hypothetical protein DPMN_110818 [Dreissena polymorpha]